MTSRAGFTGRVAWHAYRVHGQDFYGFGRSPSEAELEAYRLATRLGVS